MTRFAPLAFATSLVVGAASGGCALSGSDPDDSAQLDQGVSTTYVDAQDFEGLDVDTWFANTRKLASEFDAICGDTFCEGDFSNYTPLTFGCAVTSKAGQVRDCVWTFAASQAAVDSTTAGILTNLPTYQCPIQVSGTTTVTKLTKLLAAAPNALQMPLPNHTPSIYDQLGDCFDHPVGATPIGDVGTSPVTYVAATDYYASFTYQQKWRDTKAALKAGFDRVCGDTFCGSDYGDLQALDLECAITKSTGNVKQCAWLFGGSYKLVDEHGAGQIQEWSNGFRCNFTMSATLPQFMAAMTAPGSTDAIRRPLPGMTTTAYDALGDCLP